MIEIKESVLLAAHSNYKIGGPARYFCEPKDEGGVTLAVKWAKGKKLPLFILGGGTNILFSEKGFKGLVLKPNLRVLSRKGTTVRAGAGVHMAELLNFAADRGLAGLEWAGGLPGTLGGAIRGNAGCFGGEIKDRVTEVTSLDISGRTPKIVTRENRACRFEYRNSVFKMRDGKEIILEAALALRPGDKAAIRKAVEEKVRYRRERHPMDYPNIGSMFKNVPLKEVPVARRKELSHVVKIDPFPLVPTAYLIAQTDLCGVSCGGAMISPKHPNFIVNVLNAEPAHVRALVALAKKEVKKKFRVALEEEVIIF
ncbi:MAG: UDP-N-acetylmuramate dehydrogenase [Candidatus Yanofskybacteria bacterium]|nr:UDP-N-acetylmuramate dehydrogenase [Candidatus Yanofskybacteria bacterium]